MAQIIPLNECDGSVLGFALNRAQLMERKLIPFKKALVFDDAQITFQQIGPKVRAFVQSPEWYGAGYRKFTLGYTYPEPIDGKVFKQYSPIGPPDYYTRTAVSASLYDRSYAVATELLQSYEEQFSLRGAKKYSIKFVVQDTAVHDEVLTPTATLTDLEEGDSGDPGTEPRDAAMELYKEFEVYPVESFGVYPAALIKTKVEHLSYVFLKPNLRTMVGDVVLTTTSFTGKVRTLSGRADEDYNGGTGGGIWEGTTIPWIQVPGGGGGHASRIIATFLPGKDSELPAKEFGSTPNNDRSVAAIAATLSLRYVVANKVPGSDTLSYEVRSHTMVTGRSSSRTIDTGPDEFTFEYMWANALVDGVEPAAVVRPDGGVFAAYLCITGKSTSAAPIGLTTTVRLAGAVKAGVFDVDLSIKGRTTIQDIGRIQLITSVQSGSKFGSAPLYIATDVTAGSVTSHNLSAVALDGVTPSVVETRALPAAVADGVSLVSNGALLTVGGAKLSAVFLSDMSVKTLTLPAAALAFRCSGSMIQILTTTDTLSIPFGGGVIGEPVSRAKQAASTAAYTTSKGLAKVEYTAPAAGKSLDEKPYEFMLKPFKYTKTDDSETVTGFSTFQWEQYSITTHPGGPENGPGDYCQVGKTEVYSNYPILLQNSHAYKFGVVSTPTYGVTPVIVPGGVMYVPTVQPPISTPPSPTAVEISLGVHPVDNTGFDKLKYRPPIVEVNDYPSTYGGFIHVVGGLENEFETNYPGITSHHWTPVIDTKELVAWMQS